MTMQQPLRAQFIALIDDYHRSCGVVRESSIPE